MVTRFARISSLAIVLVFLCGPAGTPSLRAQVFRLPTANQAILHPGSEEKYYVGTVGRPWTSGTFGCVRSDGWQFHEGLDIRCIQRDKQGEPIDPVMAVADGVVAYINDKPGLSNYGNYIILRHHIEGIEIYSTYAHLRHIRDGLKTGQAVKSGEVIGTLGRTANTREGISRDRAHLHFELALAVNHRFTDWYKKNFPGQRNDHGNWNGRNFLGIDPQAIYLAQQAEGPKFSLLHSLRGQRELCRVVVQDTDFPWLKRYRPLIRRNPLADKEGIAGYEIALNFSGVPFELVPRAPSEITGKGRVHLLSVNEVEQAKSPCCKLVHKAGTRWELTKRGLELVDLLTY